MQRREVLCHPLHSQRPHLNSIVSPGGQVRLDIFHPLVLYRLLQQLSRAMLTWFLFQKPPQGLDLCSSGLKPGALRVADIKNSLPYFILGVDTFSYSEPLHTHPSLCPTQISGGSGYTVFYNLFHPEPTKRDKKWPYIR